MLCGSTLRAREPLEETLRKVIRNEARRLDRDINRERRYADEAGDRFGIGRANDSTGTA
jgi:hypothetical protein